MTVVETARDGAVLTVTLADEARRNALSRQLITELTAVLDEADTDPRVRVVVLTNTGSTFCAGADLSERGETATAGGQGSSIDQPDPTGGGGDLGTAPPTRSTPTAPPDAVRTAPLWELFARFRRSPKPYVGRIAGHCVAGGMGLAAALDVTVAADDARFGFTEVRIGVAPAIISVVCLPKLRPVDARDAMLRGRRFGAAEAARMGLITAAVPRDALDAEVGAVVADLLAGAPGAIAATKHLLARVPAMAEEEAIAWTGDLSASLFEADEAREGIAAYLHKRPPSWST